MGVTFIFTKTRSFLASLPFWFLMECLYFILKGSIIISKFLFFCGKIFFPFGYPVKMSTRRFLGQADFFFHGFRQGWSGPGFKGSDSFLEEGSFSCFGSGGGETEDSWAARGPFLWARRTGASGGEGWVAKHSPFCSMSVFLPYPHTAILTEQLTPDKIIDQMQQKFLGFSFAGKKGKIIVTFSPRTLFFP